MGNTGGIEGAENDQAGGRGEEQSNQEEDKPQGLPKSRTMPTTDQYTDPHPETTNRESKQEISLSELKLVVRESVQEPFVAPEIEKLSTVFETGVDLKSVISVNKKQKRQPLNSEGQIDAPFEVIILTVSKDLEESIKTLGEETFFKYKNNESAARNQWKLHGNGYYVNYLAKDLVSILTEHSYFEGQVVEKDGKILPDRDGILLTEKGMYCGSFKEGLADGKGTYKDRETRTTFKGEWRKGKMISGMIDNDNFRFLGRFTNSKAEGDGQIKFKQTETIYKGGFHNGLYQTRELTEKEIEQNMQVINGLYESKDYIYEGQFKKGRKDGVGTLVENERNYRDKKVKYRPPEQFYGKWEEDHFVEKLVKETGKKAAEKKKKEKQKDQENDRSGLKDSTNLKDSANLKDSSNLQDSFNPMDSGYLNESAINRFIPAKIQPNSGEPVEQDFKKPILDMTPPPIKQSPQHEELEVEV